MTAVLWGGVYDWSLSADSSGQRTYDLSMLVATDNVADGPGIAVNVPELPQTGDVWLFGNDSDPWAFCTPFRSVQRHQAKKGDPHKWWQVDFKFTTLPRIRCQDQSIENPLLEPQEVSGSFVKYTEEALVDRFGEAILNSAFEKIKGPQVEFDANRPTIKVSQNVLNLELNIFAPMIDTVNDATLWGLTSRKIKLSNVSWERRYYGVCAAYYTRTFEFDINFNTFDRTIQDEGSKALSGHWEGDSWVLEDIGGSAPDSNKPSHFNTYKDRNDENTRVILNGAGLPANTAIGTGGSSGDIGEIEVEYYSESNFLLLGIPTEF